MFSTEEFHLNPLALKFLSPGYSINCLFSTIAIFGVCATDASITDAPTLDSKPQEVESSKSSFLEQWLCGSNYEDFCSNI